MLDLPSDLVVSSYKLTTATNHLSFSFLFMSTHPSKSAPVAPLSHLWENSSSPDPGRSETLLLLLTC